MILKYIENVRRVNLDGSAVLDLQVSGVSDIPEMMSTFNSFIIAPGSICQVVKIGKFYTLDEDGKWYDSEGNEPPVLEDEEETNEP